MALYLAIGRPGGPLMVRRRSPVRTRASASPESAPINAFDQGRDRKTKRCG
jgi:hypothetical protein